MTNIQEILSDIERIEPFPKAAIRVLELSLGDSDPEEIVDIICEDPGLTTKVLRLANSAHYAPQVTIESVLQATNRLGSKAIVSLTMTTGCASFFMGYGSSSPRSNRSLWEECLHTALVGRRFALATSYKNPELAYTVGLLQNIGHVVLDRFMNRERDEVLHLMARGFPVWAAEQKVIGMDHALCGAKIARRWGLPESLVQSIRHHHDPLKTEEFKDLCTVAEAADALTALALRDNGLSLLERANESPLAGHDLGIDDVLILLEAVRSDMIGTDLALA